MRVAFLGLGKMGTGMAGRLIAAGHSLAVYNRTAERAAPFAKLGARIAESPSAARSRPPVAIHRSTESTPAAFMAARRLSSGAP